jgi:hypothetical protein
MKMVWAAIASIVFATPVSSEPSPSVRYLFDEKVSLFDWGLFRMEQVLSSAEVGVPSGYEAKKMLSAVRYDWDANRIGVTLDVFFFESPIPPSDRKAVCRNMMMVARSLLGVDASTGRLRGEFSAASLFTPSAYRPANWPKGLHTSVNDSIQLDATVWAYGKADKKNADGSMSPTGSTKCQGKLLDSRIYFAE